MEAPDTCSCYCACKAARDKELENERLEREAFWASPEGIKIATEREAQEELDRISRLPREITKEEYEQALED